jgi:hypothetical protein
MAKRKYKVRQRNKSTGKVRTYTITAESKAAAVSKARKRSFNPGLYTYS